MICLPKNANPIAPAAIKKIGFVKTPKTIPAPLIKLAIAPAANIVPITPAPIAIAFQFLVVQSYMSCILPINLSSSSLLTRFVASSPPPKIPAKFNKLSNKLPNGLITAFAIFEPIFDFFFSSNLFSAASFLSSIFFFLCASNNAF